MLWSRFFARVKVKHRRFYSCILAKVYSTKIFLNGVEPNQRLPSWWGDAGGGLAMSPAKKLPLQKLLCTGRQKGNASGVALRSHGDGQLRRKLRRWGRPGRASNSWQRIARCGGNTWPSYMPARRKGHEWVSEYSITMVMGLVKNKVLKNGFCLIFKKLQSLDFFIIWPLRIDIKSLLSTLILT